MTRPSEAVLWKGRYSGHTPLIYVKATRMQNASTPTFSSSNTVSNQKLELSATMQIPAAGLR